MVVYLISYGFPRKRLTYFKIGNKKVKIKYFFYPISYLIFIIICMFIGCFLVLELYVFVMLSLYRE